MWRQSGTGLSRQKRGLKIVRQVTVGKHRGWIGGTLLRVLSPEPMNPNQCPGLSFLKRADQGAVAKHSSMWPKIRDVKTSLLCFRVMLMIFIFQCHLSYRGVAVAASQRGCHRRDVSSHPGSTHPCARGLGGEIVWYCCCRLTA